MLDDHLETMDNDAIDRSHFDDPPDDTPTAVPKRTLTRQPLLQILFEKSIAPDDVILQDFAQHILGNLSREFATVTAKGGKFAEERAKEGMDTRRFGVDQSLRAHLLNGMLPARRIAHTLADWGVLNLNAWGEHVERLFIAGYTMHDFSKIPSAKAQLEAAGFEMGAQPTHAQVPVIEAIFREWGSRLGIDAFLAPIGGLETHLHSLIYVAANTQQRKDTMHAPSLLPRRHPDQDVIENAAHLSWLADILAYIVPTPRDVVAHDTLNEILRTISHRSQAHFVYHHVAENRGILLNFIHDAALKALEDRWRVPLLYAPSGVVYLEHIDAPPPPEPAQLVERIVARIRTTAGEKLIQTGRGAKRGNVSLQTDDSYADFFSLPELIERVPKLLFKYIVNNKTPERLASVPNWIGDENMPPLPTGKTPSVDQLAEWAGWLESTFKERFSAYDLTTWVLETWDISDLRPMFDQLIAHPSAGSGGIKHWWFWAAAHVLHRQPKDPTNVQTWIEQMSAELAAALPADLPPKARANQAVWDDLANYIARVFTLRGTKAPFAVQNALQELKRYERAKTGRGGMVCAICGEVYETRKPSETVVAFQPGVYTARVKIGGSDNKRSLCSICALEQLLRQLFAQNQDSGSRAENQRVRYLAFYPTYFYSPETLELVRRVYQQISAMRISDGDLRGVLERADLGDPLFWQQLEDFLLLPDNAPPSPRVLRYDTQAPATFFMVGLRVLSREAVSDTESWILPAFFALILSLCLDLKVVVSESGVPLMLEANELNETIWYDGAHPAIQALAGETRLRLDDLDERPTLPIVLARLAAAYLIHLDTEYKPPKENYHRFAPIAHSLMESPLYVFHYLAKQRRADRPVNGDKIRRYIDYADSLFNPQGDPSMSHARELVAMYRQFYMVNEPFKASSYTLLRPIDIVADTVLRADPQLFDSPEALIELACGELKNRFDSSEAKAFIKINKETAPVMAQFCTKFVNDIFYGIFQGDVAALRGKQLNLLRSACEFIYLDESSFR
jgi:CRISPR-associated protein Csc3